MKSKMRIASTLFFLAIGLWSFGQKAFQGKLVYKVSISDTSLQSMFPTSTMTIYTNDTVVRIETSTETLGTQVLIQHIEKKKAYLMVQSPLGAFAIQIPEEKETKLPNYTFSKGNGEKVVLGLKSKALKVHHASVREPLDFFYHKDISAKYIPGFEHFPGLLTDYLVVSKDGIYRHELVEMDRNPVDRNLFGIPSDYKRISMSEFVDLMTPGGKEDK